MQVQCEQCKSSAAGGRYQPRARNAEDTTVWCKLSSQAHDRLSATPQHTTREAKSTANECSPHTPRHHSCSRGGQATDKRSRRHAPRRCHPQAPCAFRRRPPTRYCLARAAAPACFAVWYRPGPAVRRSCYPSPTPALSHSKQTHHTTHRAVSNASAVRAMQVKCS